MDSLQLVSQQLITNEKLSCFSDGDELSAIQKLSMMEQLQHHDTPKELLKSFATEAATYVDLAAIRLTTDAEQFKVEIAKGQRYYRSFNINTSDSRLDTLTVIRNTPFSRGETNVLKQLVAILNPQLKQSLILHRLMKQVRQDYLTGIGNRSHFDESLSHAIEQESRQSTGLMLILLDLNRFKHINDTHGHQVGDEVLVKFSQALQHAIRGGDVAFRLGGDEFAILLQPANEVSVEKVISRINSWLASNSMTSDLKISTSVGYSCWNEGMTANQMIKHADEAMYRHKFAS